MVTVIALSQVSFTLRVAHKRALNEIENQGEVMHASIHSINLYGMPMAASVFRRNFQFADSLAFIISTLITHLAGRFR